MTVVLYLDLFFILNFIMDYLLLFLTKQILELPGKPFRLMIAALAGALGACVMVLIPACWQFPGALAACVLPALWMTALAFPRCPTRELGRRMLVLWLLSAAAGGALRMVWEHMPIRGGQAGFTFLLPAALGLCSGGSILIRILKSQLRRRSRLYQVTLRYRERTKTLQALWDTGNRLYEPYGHQPVHVITYEACRDLCERVNRVIYIPFSAVGKEYGMLPGIQVDEMEVSRDGTILHRYERPWIAVSRQPLCADHRYEMLLHGDIET